ncbi:MAG: phosphomannomutase/phosphoglucomutase [Alphaproteobacteria bacterium]|nr:MAG: phosphomannomutase/phosphoglucomutase [Alphaproteobacteria bacterium]
MNGHRFHPSILRAYDIRGVVGDTLGEDDAQALGRTLGSVIRSHGGDSVVVGYDGRTSSPALTPPLAEGLAATGLTVKLIGLGPTPMLYYAVHALDADGGVMVTGSHNPAEYNGFKMMIGKKPVFDEQIQDLGRLAAAGDFTCGAGRIEAVTVVEGYVERLLRDLDGAALNVVWDTGNGAAGPVVEKLIRRLPGTHTLIYGEVDGTFPNHHPDPTEEKNLADLKREVLENAADMGLAFDGDGDRLGAIDGKGRVVWGDQILSILAADVLREVPGATIIADVKAGQKLFDRIAALGGKPLMWRTGHSVIKAKMAETQSPLAGEMSGHIFFAHRYYGFDDALYAAVRLLGAIARQGGSLTALKSAMPKVADTPELRIPCAEERKFAVVREVVERLRARNADFTDIDGARVNTKDGWWLLRASNTQAALVARCEGRNKAALARLKAALAAELTASGLAPPADF